MDKDKTMFFNAPKEENTRTKEILKEVLKVNVLIII